MLRVTFSFWHEPTGGGPPPPGDTYVIEDGSQDYVTEDGLSSYVPEA